MNRETPLRRRLGRAVGAVSIVAGTLVGALALTTGAATANTQLDASTNVDCGANPAYDTGEAAEAAKLTGYTCAALLNKGSLENNNPSYQQVGEAWYFNDNGTLRVRTFLFGGMANNDFSEALKVCLDDDADPINGILVLEGKDGPGEPTCTGGDAALTVTETTVPNKATNAEEGAGLFEVLIGSVTKIADGATPAEPGGWNIDVNDFTEVVLHFNAGDLSINSFFQAATSTTPTSVPKPTLTVSDECGTGNATVTIPETAGATFRNGTANGTILAEGSPIGLSATALTIIGVADANYVLLNANQDGTWTFGPYTETNTAACPTVTRPTITVTDPCGTGNATITIPTTNGATFHVGNAEGAVLAEGTPIALPNGKVIGVADGETPLGAPTQDGVWDFGTFTETNTAACSTGGGGGGASTLEADPIDPRVIRECDEVDQYRIPNRDGVVYLVDGEVAESGYYDLAEGDEVVITAVAAAGYTIPADETVRWEFEGEAVEECPVEEEPVVVVPEEPEGEGAQVEIPRVDPAPAALPVLAFTGLETAELMMAAITLLGLGLAMVISSNRRIRAATQD